MAKNDDLFNKVYWTTKDGRKLDVDDMSSTHIKNAFKMLLRNIEYLKEKEKIVRKSKKAFEVNGELASEDQFAYEIYMATGLDINELGDSI